MNLNELFFEFSNEHRYEVFKSLLKGNKRHSDLKRELNLPASEISRHLKRLSKKTLVSKDIDNRYGITNIGTIFFRVFNIFEVSLKHKGFFNSHDIAVIPLHLILQLGELKTLELSDKTMENIELWADMVKNTDEFIYAVTNQYQSSLFPIVEEKNVKIKAVIEKKLYKEFIRSYNNPGNWSNKFQDLMSFIDRIKIRTLEQIEFSLLVSDKGAILFLTKDGKIDYSECLIDNHPSFIKWAIELFDCYWQKGRNLKQFTRKEKIGGK